MTKRIGAVVGKRIKALREARKLTQAQLGALAGKSTETISNFERGTTVPSLTTLADIAERLKVGVGEFFDAKGDFAPEAALDAHLKLLTPDDVQLLLDFARLLQRHRTATGTTRRAK
jgi:transcriptional regulator with XRE-family HTH domain